MSTDVDDHTVRKGLRQASAMLRCGSVEAALELLERLDRAHPGRGDIRRMRGIVLARTGRLAEAEAVLRYVADRSPASPEAASDHAQVLLGLGRADEALERLLPLCDPVSGTPLAELGPVFAFNLGMAYKASGQAREAAGPLQRVLEHQPGQYDALIALGDVNKALGQVAEAADCYRAAIAVQPETGTAWWSLSNLKSGGFSDAEAGELERRAGAAGRDPAQQVYFEFALASALDARDRTAEAFARYAAGNRLKRRFAPWHRDRFSDWLGELRAAMRDVPMANGADGLPDRPRPVFIVSLPRSGSTLTEQILSAHSQVTAASELPWLPRVVAETSNDRGSGIAQWARSFDPQQWCRIGTAYLEKCRRWYRDTPVFTDKLPGNLPYIGVMLAMHSGARVVGVRRDPMDVCWSCYRQLFISGSEFSYDLEDLAAYWKDADRHLAFWQERAPERVRILDYETLVTDPEGETRNLLEFLDLPFEPACLRPQDVQRAVNTASAAQVRESIHTAGIGHWRRYREHLGVLTSAFGR